MLCLDKRWLICITILLSVLISYPAFSEDISLNPCEGDVVITEDGNNIYLDSKCFNIQFPKNYGNEIVAYDKYNQKSFDLKAMQLYDVSVANPNDKKTISFQDKNMDVSYSDDTISYTLDDGVNDMILSYTVKNGLFKQGIEINNWVSNWADANLILRTKYHKDDNANAHFNNQPAVVDGIEQDLVVDSVTEQESTFYQQVLYSGNSFTKLIQDPLYQVDYSPVPASYLQIGSVSSDLDSGFQNNTNITDGVSDNNTGTTYQIASYTTTNATTQNFTDGTFEGTSYLAGVGDIIAIDYTINTDLIFGDTINVCFRASRTSTDVVPAIYIGTTQRYVVSVPVGTTPSTYTCQDVNLSYLSNGTNRIGLGCSSGCTASQRLYYSEDTTNPDNNTYFYDGSWSQITTYDLAGYITYNLIDLNSGYAIKGNWEEVYDNQYEYFLKIYKTSGDDNITVYAYNGSESISNQYKEEEIVGTGWFNINVTNLIDYMTNTVGLNYTSLRFFTEQESYISEVYLRKETNDTTAPSITDCQTNTTELSCGGTARLQCNVTDNLDVDYVLFEVNGTNFSTTKQDDIYYYDISPTYNTTSEPVIINWADTFAYDILANLATDNTDIDINYTCCVEDWGAQYTPCLTNDSQIKYYVDANSCGTYDDLPVDNGSVVVCDYCSPNLQKAYTSECYYNGTVGQKDYYWYDNHFTSCCDVTLLLSDCSVLYYPYNVTGSDNCTFTLEDFELELDTEVFFGFGFGGLSSDKVYGKIFINDTNNTYTCLTYVTTTDTGQVLQTNPPYTKRTTSTISLIPKEIEDREFFVTQSGLASVYWTSNNLVIDGREYKFGVECAGNGNHLKSETVSSVEYEPLNSPITRMFWVNENIMPLILGLIIIIVLVFVASMLYYAFKRR